MTDPDLENNNEQINKINIIRFISSGGHKIRKKECNSPQEQPISSGQKKKKGSTQLPFDLSSCFPKKNNNSEH